MTKNFFLFLLIISLPLFSLEEFRIDFGNYGASLPAGNWNTIYDSAPNDSQILIDYNTGSNTNVTYSGTNWAYDTGSGWNSANTDWIDADAAADALYADTDASFTISGLAGERYRVELVSSRGTTYISDITIGGVFSDSTGLGAGNSDDWNTYNDGYNSGNWMVWPEVIPVNGSITVNFGINSSSFVISNCVLIREVSDGTPGLWKGVTSPDWSTSTNWDDGNVPTETIDVTIPAGCTYYPDIDEEALCRNMTIEDGGNLIISDNSLNVKNNMTLDLGSSFTNNGTLKFSGLASVLNDNRDPKSSLGNVLVED